MAFSLSSDAFPPNGSIPARFTCDGEGISPELSWSGTSSNTRAFALIADDPDAPSGVFTHWLVYDLPASTHSLDAGQPAVEQLPDGAYQGRNSFGRIGYGAPCPPPGPPHHYRFHLYALSAKTNLPPGADEAQLLEKMQGQILAETELVGLYARQS